MKQQKLVRSVKKKKEINLTLFYRKFAVFHALAQLYELQAAEREKFFTQYQLQAIKTYEKQNKEDAFALEKAMVQYYDCDSNRPTCLYDFTMKVIMFDY